MADSTSSTCEVCGRGRGVPGAHAVLTFPDGKSRYYPLCTNCITDVVGNLDNDGKEKRGENRKRGNEQTETGPEKF